ncbi:MAG TPA: hypothetical protein PLP42_21015, partial [Acidobacteriota bacterium]|nr:hypothetical protein [Acidobacteriota bacterium]
AKQNRVLNTTVLVREHSEVVVPVSCTEQGRWHYRTARFEDSAHIMAYKLRARKQRSVSRSLAFRAAPMGDQAEVWEGIRDMHARLNLRSATGAMRDAFAASRETLDSWLNSLTHKPGQRGAVFFINGKPAGFEWLSRESAMRILLPRLARSYAMQVLLDHQGKEARPISFNGEDLKNFVTRCQAKVYPGVSRGQEWRFESPDGQGAGLVEDQVILHLSLFWEDQADRHPHKAGGGRRSVPFSRSYWVVPGRLLAGCYPGDKDPETARQKLEALLESGIRRIVNVMQPGEISHGGAPFVPYEGLLQELAATRGLSIDVRHIPVADASTPSVQTMRDILDAIDEFLSQGLSTYVHCWGGRGRTGTVVGCYLARHGLAVGQDVLAHVAFLRSNTPDADLPSPETRGQRQLVVSWKPGE